MASRQRFLIRHVGNMGDMVFLIPPVLETLKKRYPECHITFVTAWGYKVKLPWKQIFNLSQSSWRNIRYDLLDARLQRRAIWGLRNQGGYSIALMMTNPHIHQLIHWHDAKLDLESATCREDGRSFPTWNPNHYNERKKSGNYDAVWELDFGLTSSCNPIEKVYQTVGLPQEHYSKYQLYFTEQDKAVAAAVMMDKPKPRIVLTESLASESTRGWDVDKIPQLAAAIKNAFGVNPLWFGGRHVPEYEGRPLTLRQNIATMLYADAAIGVLSGPLHFAAAAGLPTLTLFSDQPLHRAAPAYFLNEYIEDPHRRHRTLLGPSPATNTFLKSNHAPDLLTAEEQIQQNYTGWQNPGRQSTKSGLASITVDEIMIVLHDMLKKL